MDASVVSSACSRLAPRVCAFHIGYCDLTSLQETSLVPDPSQIYAHARKRMREGENAFTRARILCEGSGTRLARNWLCRHVTVWVHSLAHGRPHFRGWGQAAPNWCPWHS